MHRRRFVTTAAAATATAVAGCLEGAPTGSDGDDDPTDTPTETPTATPTGPELTESSFEVLDVACGSKGTDSEVTIGDEQVTVEGTVDGRNGCYRAELARGEYDGDADTLFVEVEAVEGDDADMCTQCIVEVNYRTTFEFDGGEPDVVDLHQRGAFTESRSETGSGSASQAATPTATPTETDAGGY